MIRYKTDVRGAVDDLHHIRSVLDGPAALRPLAPHFLGAGVVWLTYAILTASIILPDQLGYLWPNIAAFDFDTFGPLTMVVYDYGKWVLWAFLLVQCALWQREKKARAMTGAAQRMLSTWQVFLMLYLVFAIALEVAQGLTVTTEGQMFSESQFYLWQTAGLLQSALVILFPALPLILTGNYLEDKVLALFGWFSLIWAVAAVAVPMISLYQGGEVAVNLVVFSVVLSAVMGFLAPIGLLLAAWRLGRKGE